MSEEFAKYDSIALLCLQLGFGIENKTEMPIYIDGGNIGSINTIDKNASFFDIDQKYLARRDTLVAILRLQGYAVNCDFEE